MYISRRGFLASVGAGVAALTAGKGYRNLVPFVMPPEDLVPGTATWYASTCRECPAGCGMLLRNREARLVKAEGNPLSFIGQGRLCARGQASLQGLYDPDRLPRPRQRPRGGAWQDFAWDQALKALGPVLSDTKRIGIIADLRTGAMAELLPRFLEALGAKPADVLYYEPFNYEPLRVANQSVFGRAEIPDYRIDRADLLLSFGADFLETWLSPVQLTRRFHEMRRVKDGKRGRFIYIGPRRSPTATQADRCFLVKPGNEHEVALALLYAVGAGLRPPSYDRATAATGLRREDIAWIVRQYELARAPLALGGSPLPLTIPAAPTRLAPIIPELLVARLNQRSAGQVLDWNRTHSIGQAATMAETALFLERARDGQFEVLIILGSNPVYSLPPDLKAVEALRKAKTVICLNTFQDETMDAVADYALPINAPAESWDDSEPQTGVHALQQPAMGTLFDSRDAGDVLMQLAQASGADLNGAFGAQNYYDFLRNRWRRLWQHEGGAEGSGFGVQESPLPHSHTPTPPHSDFEEWWRKSVQEGGRVFPSSTPKGPKNIAQGAATWVGGAPSLPGTLKGFNNPPGATGSSEVRLYVHPSLHFYDGRGANKRWLQEIPDSMTRAVWGSWVELHPDTARQLGVKTGDPITLSVEGRTVEAPAHVWEGVAPGVAAIATGQGHTSYGRFAQGVGANAFTLLSAAHPVATVIVAKAPGNGDHVLAHGVQDQHGREIALVVPASQVVAGKAEEITLPLKEGYSKEHGDIYQGHDHPLHRWAMAVDLDRCSGCNACIAACYAENNIPVAGKREVGRGHDAPWLRLDRYDEQQGGETRTVFLPLMCQQCDSAPCESVCPVFAAVHGSEGLNEQVYNRCVGTRYCSNNCPYKARRFNWFNFEWPEPLQYQLNPDVTVRARGVMEKCSFCVQRIKEVTIKAKAEGRKVTDGEITPACAQTCPAAAFVFGDLLDPNARISRLVREDRRRYQVLHELNTKPAVFYQKKIVSDDI